jgi:hypothetical protein
VWSWTYEEGGRKGGREEGGREERGRIVGRDV